MREKKTLDSRTRGFVGGCAHASRLSTEIGPIGIQFIFKPISRAPNNYVSPPLPFPQPGCPGQAAATTHAPVFDPSLSLSPVLIHSFNFCNAFRPFSLWLLRPVLLALACIFAVFACLAEDICGSTLFRFNFFALATWQQHTASFKQKVILAAGKLEMVLLDGSPLWMKRTSVSGVGRRWLLQSTAKKGFWGPQTGRFAEMVEPLHWFVEDQRQAHLPIMIEVKQLKALELAQDQVEVTAFKASRQDQLKWVRTRRMRSGEFALTSTNSLKSVSSNGITIEILWYVRWLYSFSKS